MSYLPDPNEKKSVDRKFFWSIISTLRPKYVQLLIKDAADQRAEHLEREQVKKDEIVIEKTLLEELMA